MVRSGTAIWSSLETRRGQGGVVLPAIIAGAKKGARTCFLEFFTVPRETPV
jgi:hypothetical protein